MTVEAVVCGSDSTAVDEGGGDDGSWINMRFSFRKEDVSYALIESVNCAS